MVLDFGDTKLEFDENYEIPYTRDELLVIYWHFHPRFRFLKSCMDGNFLDIGSGGGGLQFWKDWEKPIRSGLTMYAADLKRGEYVDRYQDFKVVDFDKADFPWDQGFFDNVFSAHVMEHLKNPENCIKNIDKILKSGGLVYIEQPNHNSVNVPKKELFIEAGIECAKTTTNFYDDRTHVRPYSAKEIIELFEEYVPGKFEVIEGGTIWNNYLKDIMFAYAYQNQDTEIWTYATWLHYEWSDYVALRKLF